MDLSPVAVVLLIAGAVCVAITAYVISLYRARRLIQQAEQWILVEAKIESGGLESTHASNKIILPTFAFSYKVSGNYYSGRFSLLPKPFPDDAAVDSMIEHMIGRKILLRYDPDNPQIWFIPDKFIDGYKVEQKIGMHAIYSIYPYS